MAARIARQSVEALQVLCKENAAARRFFEWLARFKNDAKETRVGLIRNAVGISRAEVISIAKELDAVGCARFIPGRRGGKSRLRWLCSRVLLGKAVNRGMPGKDDLPLPTGGRGKSGAIRVRGSGKQPDRLSEIKAELAKLYGVAVANIEIFIKV